MVLFFSFIFHSATSIPNLGIFGQRTRKVKQEYSHARLCQLEQQPLDDSRKVYHFYEWQHNSVIKDKRHLFSRSYYIAPLQKPSDLALRGLDFIWRVPWVRANILFPCPLPGDNLAMETRALRRRVSAFTVRHNRRLRFLLPLSYHAGF